MALVFSRCDRAQFFFTRVRESNLLTMTIGSFTYSSVYVLLVFLLRRNPCLNHRWPREKLSMLRFMSRDVVLRKLRSVLFAATRSDILAAYYSGYFSNRDLCNSMVRVLKARQLTTSGGPNTHEDNEDDSETDEEEEEEEEDDEQYQIWNNRVFLDEETMTRWERSPTAGADDEFSQIDGAVPGPSGTQSSSSSSAAVAAADTDSDTDSDTAGWIYSSTGEPQVKRPRVNSINASTMIQGERATTTTDTPAPAAVAATAVATATAAADSEEKVSPWINWYRERVAARLRRLSQRVQPQPRTPSPSDAEDIDSDATYWSVEERRRENERARLAMLEDSSSSSSFPPSSDEVEKEEEVEEEKEEEEE